MYKLVNQPDGTFANVVMRVADWTFIPLSEPTSFEYQQYAAWLAEGNTPIPADEVTQ